MDSISKALGDLDRSYRRAKAAASAAEIVTGSAGVISTPSLSRHRQQYGAFSGWQYVAIRAIAQRVAGRKLNVGFPGDGGGSSRGEDIEPLASHPMLDAFARPNETMTSWALWYVTVCSLELTGKAYLWIGEAGIWPLPTHWVEPVHGERLFQSWRVRPDGQPEGFTLAGPEVAYFSLPDPAYPLGSVSPLQSQARAINADDAIQTAQQAAFANGILPRYAIKAGRVRGADGKLTDRRPVLKTAQRNQLISAIRQLYRGALNAHEPLIVDGMIEDIVRISANPNEMDFLDSGRQTKSRIMQAFGVNPLIVGEIEGANRAQAVVAEQSFCSNVVNPLLELLGQVLTSQVAPRFDPRLLVWFQPAEADDPEMTLRRWELGLRFGTVSANEYRTRVLNLPETDYGEVPVAMADSLSDGVAALVDQRLAGLGAEVLAGGNGRP